MSDSDFSTLNELFSDNITLVLPFKSTVVELKIRSVNIYHRIISETSVVLYGDYDILLLYKSSYRNSRFRYFYKTYKSYFLRSFDISKLNTLDILDEDDLFISIKTPPKCEYKLSDRRLPRLSYRYFTLCKISISSQLIFTLNTYSNDINSKFDYTDNEPNHSFIVPDLVNNNEVESLESIQDNPGIYKQVNIKKDLIINSPTLSSYNSIETKTQPTIKNRNLNKPIKEQLNTIEDKNSIKKNIIEVKSVIGTGSKDIFICKYIYIPSNSPLIWKIDNINHTPIIDKITIISDLVFIDGHIDTSIIYKFPVEDNTNICSGTINFIDTVIPFSTFIKIDKDESVTLKNSDHYKILDSIIVGSSYNLINTNNRTCSEELFDTLKENIILHVNILILRSSLLKVKVKVKGKI